MAHDVLIVDDEADIRLLVEAILQDEGFRTRGAANSQEALEMVRSRPPHLVILDIWLQNSQYDGLELLKILKEENPGLPVVMISGHGNIETAVKTIKLGAYDFIEKPFKADRLLLLVERAIEAARLRRENEELRRKTVADQELVGISPQVEELREAILKVGPTASRVLLTGGPGTGKEVVARLLHSHSKRAQGPFVVMNCAMPSPERIEQELFGLEQDAAAANGRGGKPGALERAHGGTLLLDEVSELPLVTQAKLIRVLQEHTFERSGGNKPVEVDVRVIAASCRRLDDLVAAELFRADLFYRLNVVPLHLPLLRERKEDIPFLARHFIEGATQSAGLKARKLAQDALVSLQSYDWPGNVRQLRNVIDWLLIMTPEDANEIRAEMLPGDISSLLLSGAMGEKIQDILNLSLRDAREYFEKHYLESQMLRFGGNISKTADFVGMERSSLHRKLRSLGLSN